MSWNYRVIRHEDGSHALHEVYYDEAGAPSVYSERPCGFVGDTLDDLLASLDLARKAALERPILDAQDLPGRPADGA
jgi:hypothetical protein